MIEILIAIGIFWLSWQTGLRMYVLFGLPVTDKKEIMVYSTGLGLAFLALLVFSLGQMILLYSWIVWGLLIILTLIYLVRPIQIEYEESPGEKIKYDLITKILLSVIGIAGIVNILGALTPEIRHDSLQYHLSIPHYYILHHQMLDVPYTIYHFYSLNMEMLYTLCLLLKNGALGKLLHAGFAMLSAYGIYLIAKRYCYAPIPLLGAVLFYTLPQVGWMSSTTFNENGWMFYGVVSIMCWMNWWKKRGNRWLYLTGIFCGLGITIKIPVIAFYPFLLGLATLVILIQKRDWKNVKALVIYSILIFIPILPWLIRNYIYTLNPVFPLLTNLFPSYGDYDYAGKAFHGIRQLPTGSLGQYFQRMSDAFIYIQVNGNGIIGLFALSVLFGILYWKTIPGEIKFLLLYGISAWLIYSLIEGGLDGRFIYPTYPIMAVVSSYMIFQVLKTIPRLTHFVMLSLMLVCLGTFIYGKYGFTQDFQESLTPVLSVQARDSYLETHLPLYSAYRYVNQNLPKDARLILPVEYGALYCERDYQAQSEFDRVPFGEITEHCTTPDEILGRLKEWNITYLVIPRILTEMEENEGLFPKFLKQHGEVLFQSQQFAVVKVLYPPVKK